MTKLVAGCLERELRYQINLLGEKDLNPGHSAAAPCERLVVLDDEPADAESRERDRLESIAQGLRESFDGGCQCS